MKTAVLCNGPSRVLFSERDKYNYVIGCNIPWTKVNSTVILDVNVLNNFVNPVNFYASRNAWRECRKRELLVNYLVDLFDPLPEYDSAGHAAARQTIKLGATQIDIYGCDSWFVNNTESYTHQWIDSRSLDMTKHVSVWRSRWYELIAKHPDVVFNFIGE